MAAQPRRLVAQHRLDEADDRPRLPPQPALDTNIPPRL
jgi:hypothetical protein